MIDDDYSQYSDSTAIGEGELSQLSKLAVQQIEAQALVARLEKQLAEAVEQLKNISENLIPELMRSVGLTELKTSFGWRITVQEAIRATVPSARKLEALSWLREHGHAALIKRSVSVKFGRGEDDSAAELSSELNKWGYPVEDEATVHPSTLSAFVKEKLTKGEEVPTDLFNVFHQRVSKIDLVKK